MKKVIEQILNIGTLISTAGFVGATLIQIYARTFLESAPSWTEEISRFFFVYAMSFAAGLAIKGNYYVYLDLFYAKMSTPYKRLVDIIVSVSVIILFFIMGIFAIQYMSLGLVERSPSLGIPMIIPFTSIFLMSLFVCLYTIYELKSKSKAS